MIRTLLFLLLFGTVQSHAAGKSWDNGNLCISPDNRFLMHANGNPFFYMADTGWLLPERLNRDEAVYYLSRCHDAGYNVVQVQVMNGAPCYNIYGQPSLIDGWSFSDIGSKGVYGYWDHLDFIIDTAERFDIYVGMVCVWGSMVKSGLMTENDAREYGQFLAKRYKDRPNIIWIMGGDITGDIHPEVWDALATTIKGIDNNHLMSFHPRGRHTSAQWWSNAQWIDFHMFQSGHRRYGQRMGNADYPIPDGTEEDNWMYVDSTWAYKPVRPVLDAEPGYEDIPKGLHDPIEGRWQDHDVRRYAYWSVFAGSCGHAYGHNSIMQMLKPGYSAGYSADGVAKPWYLALDDPGYNQMRYLKNLMLSLPYFERIPDQSLIVGRNGDRYKRLVATRGNDYMLIYNYLSVPMMIDLTKISGNKKNVWWFSPCDGQLYYIGKFDSKITTFNRQRLAGGANDGVLIAIDSDKNYIQTQQMDLCEPASVLSKPDFNE